MMIADLVSLPAQSENGGIHVVVESPRGSRAKIKYEPKLRAFKFARPLVAGLFYPYDWGFIPSTLAPDGDPLDAMVFSDMSMFPGVVVECRPFGVIRLEQNKKGSNKRQRNDRLIVIPVKMPRFDSFRTPKDLPPRWRHELEDFFVAATRFEEKDPKLLGWAGPREAERMVKECMKAAEKAWPGGGQVLAV